jgi:hypothetical protein
MAIAIEEVLALVEQELGLASQQQSAAAAAAQFQTLLSALNANLALGQLILQQVVLLPFVARNQAAIIGQILATQQQLELKIGSPQQTGVAVTLPLVPPAGYGGANVSDIATAVWSDTTTYVFPYKGELVQLLYNSVHNQSLHTGLRYAATPLFYVFGSDWEADPGLVVTDYPVSDVTTILPTDTVLSWLTRVDPAHTWFANFVGNSHVWSVSTADPQFKWVFALDDVQFANIYKSQLKAAPVWPGLAHVTLGAPVAFAGQFTVGGPMDGVIVDITSVAGRFGTFVYGAMTAYRRIGSLTFVSDNGDAEPYQVLDFVHGLYTPNRMTQADHAIFRADVSVTGTVTPWVRA